MTKENKDYYTPEEVAEVFSINVLRVYRYIRDKRIKAHVVNGEQRIPQEEFEKFVDLIKAGD